MPPPTRPSPSRSVFTLGSFDGVHAGHQALIHAARALADSAGPGVRVVAQVFDPSPVSILRPDAAPTPISTFSQRARWLREAGADEVLRLEPTRELLSLTAADFVARQVELHHPLAWVEGPDFRFGKGREGDAAALTRLGNQHGFTVHIVEPITATLDDHSIVPARSTMTRWLLAHGRVRDAAIVLTRPHQLTGTVIPGDRRGRTIGYPTANLDTPCYVPADGVYAALAHLPDGRALPAALSIGTKPTFGDGLARAVEAFILTREAAGREWSPLPGLPEYGWPLTLDLIAWIRDQVTFPDLPSLLTQIERDCGRVAEILALSKALAPASRILPQEASA